jgi:hypothetical protein
MDYKEMHFLCKLARVHGVLSTRYPYFPSPAVRHLSGRIQFCKVRRMLVWSSALLQRSGSRPSRLVGGAIVRRGRSCGWHRTRRAERSSNAPNQALAGWLDPASSDQIPQCFEMFAGPFCAAPRAASQAASRTDWCLASIRSLASGPQCCAARSDLRRRVCGQCARHVRAARGLSIPGCGALEHPSATSSWLQIFTGRSVIGMPAGETACA